MLDFYSPLIAFALSTPCFFFVSPRKSLSDENQANNSMTYGIVSCTTEKLRWCEPSHAAHTANSARHSPH